jgi:heme A synthase
MNKFCPSCGNALEEGQKFCGTCGKSAEGSPTAGAPVQGSNTEAAQPAQAGARIAAKVNTTHLLLCILLGVCGAHCFAAGKKKRGITELALFLLSWVVLIVGHINFDASYYAFPIMYALLGEIFVFFLLCWIPDLVRIVKGTFADKPELPRFLNVIFPGKFTKKRLIVIAAFVGLGIIGDMLSGSGELGGVGVIICIVHFGQAVVILIAGVWMAMLWFIGIDFEQMSNGTMGPVTGYLMASLGLVYFALIIVCVRRTLKARSANKKRMKEGIAAGRVEPAQERE